MQLFTTYWNFKTFKLTKFHPKYFRYFRICSVLMCERTLWSQVQILLSWPRSRTCLLKLFFASWAVQRKSARARASEWAHTTSRSILLRSLIGATTVTARKKTEGTVSQISSHHRLRRMSKLLGAYRFNPYIGNNYCTLCTCYLCNITISIGLLLVCVGEYISGPWITGLIL